MSGAQLVRLMLSIGLFQSLRLAISANTVRGVSSGRWSQCECEEVDAGLQGGGSDEVSLKNALTGVTSKCMLLARHVRAWSTCD